VARAKAAFAARATGPLAALTFDSTVDGDEPVPVRRLRFASASLSVDAVVEGCAGVANGPWPRGARAAVRPARTRRGCGAPRHRGVQRALQVRRCAELMRLRLAEADGSDPSYTEWFQV